MLRRKESRTDELQYHIFKRGLTAALGVPLQECESALSLTLTEKYKRIVNKHRSTEYNSEKLQKHIFKRGRTSALGFFSSGVRLLSPTQQQGKTKVIKVSILQ